MKTPVSLALGMLLSLGTCCSVHAADTAVATAKIDPFQIPASDEVLPGSGPMRRADWFQNIWTERRSGWASSVAKDQGAVVFLGDSITQGWWDLGSFMPGTHIANRGISGDTTRGVLFRLKDDVIALNPKAVVLLIGTNDIDDNASPETITGNLRLIIAELRRHNARMPVVLSTVLPSSPTKNRSAERIKKLNTLYREAVQDEPQVSLVDAWSVFADVQGDAKLEDMPDLLHPNALGYAKYIAALRPTLETLGLVPSWPDSFEPEAGFSSLFNGAELSGWQYEQGKPFTKLKSSPDGRFVVNNGRLVVVASKKEYDYRQLSTTKFYGSDFVLKLEFRASPNADSGVFVRGVQVQCRDYPAAGPFSALKNFRSLDWNELVITVRGRLAHVTCNGEVLVDAMELPATGPIGLESDRGQVEYRRLRLSTR